MERVKDRKMDAKKIYRDALDKFGADMQALVCIEEMSELQKELCKQTRGKGHRLHIAEEIADVQIMLAQMIMLYDLEDFVNEWRAYKLERLENLVDSADKKE